MSEHPFATGYNAGLVNDRSNPHALWSLAWLPWHLGNSAGLDVHCAVVEAVYLHHEEALASPTEED